MERKARITDKGKSQASSKQKALDVTRRSSKDRVAQSAEQQRLHNKPGSALESTSKSKDLKIKSGDRRMSDSRQRQPDATQSSRQSLQRHFAALHLGERSRNAGLRREIPALAGGGDPDDSSSQQQAEASEQQARAERSQRYADATQDLIRQRDHDRGRIEGWYNQGRISTSLQLSLREHIQDRTSRQFNEITKKFKEEGEEITKKFKEEGSAT